VGGRRQASEVGAWLLFPSALALALSNSNSAPATSFPLLKIHSDSGFCSSLTYSLRFGDVNFSEWSASELSGFCVFFENDKTDLRQFFYGLGELFITTCFEKHFTGPRMNKPV